MAHPVEHYRVYIVFVGLYGNAPKPPCVLGYEAGGVVSQLGEGVDDFKVKQVKTSKTRMHSSRMRTVRCSGQPPARGGCQPARGVCPGGRGRCLPARPPPP